jgi:hypothetical protein
LQELGTDQIGHAYVTATVTVWDEDPAVATEKLRLVEKVVQGRDFTAITESLNAIKVWLGSLPGHVYANVRQPPISTLNLAHGPDRPPAIPSPQTGAATLLPGRTLWCATRRTIRSPSAGDRVSPVSLSPPPSLSTQSRPSVLSITSTMAGFSSQAAMEGPSAVRNIRAPRDVASARKDCTATAVPWKIAEPNVQRSEDTQKRHKISADNKENGGVVGWRMNTKDRRLVRCA